MFLEIDRKYIQYSAIHVQSIVSECKARSKPGCKSVLQLDALDTAWISLQVYSLIHLFLTC